jgi:hypothetical protein
VAKVDAAIKNDTIKQRSSLYVDDFIINLIC